MEGLEKMKTRLYASNYGCRPADYGTLDKMVVQILAWCMALEGRVDRPARAMLY
jgi:hypothetical protein